MRFTIINQHTNNFGDDIAGISLIDKLEEEFGKDTQIDIIYNSGDNLKIERKNVHHLNDVTLKKNRICKYWINYFLWFSRNSSKN